MNTTTSPAAAAMPTFRERLKFASGQLATLMRPAKRARSAAVPSVDGPFTTTTSSAG
jgi:hypothetical protein